MKISGTTNSSMLPLVVQDLTFNGNHGPIIKNVSLTITHPGVTVVMGPNGAGKSVLMRLLHGLIDPHAGSVSWCRELNSGLTRQRQAMLFQRPVMLRRSVLANLKFVLHQRQAAVDDEACMELLAQVRLQGKAQHSARHLSGGEQQRLALARALALDPDVLFMDEPAASLDPSSTQTIESVVRDCTEQGAKVIFVTHDVAQARRVADEVVFLHHGEILEQSSALEFFNNPQSNEARQYLAGEIVI
jgi:tungstate transport system ATP-binding protein